MISSLPTIPEAVDAMGRGVLTPIELVEYCLERIRRIEPHVHAWVLVDEEGARREAERLTRLARQARPGERLRPLHGIPIGIKDIIDVAGWPTKCGSPLREHRIARTDASVVSRLRAAGAILLGKTVTTQFASFDPPPTRNPWNVQRTPGGSSSGSAAAVATEMCAAALGTQTGGSIIRPASFCGVVGLKPTYGAIPLDGIEPLAWHMDHPGTITRTVVDAAVLFDVLRNQSALDRPAVAEPRLLCLGGFFQDRADESVRQAFSQAVARLRAAGLLIESAKSCPDIEAALSSHRQIMAVEAAAHHRSEFQANREQFGPKIRSLIEEGLKISAVDYAAALGEQVRLRAEWSAVLADGQVWVMPSTTSPAPTIETTGDPAFHSPWSLTGLPEVTIPTGLSDDGLPCGMQFVGAPGSEATLLRMAANCAERLGFVARPPE